MPLPTTDPEAPSSGAPRHGTVVRALHFVEDGILVLLLAMLVVIAGAQIVLRNIFDSGLVWADPALRVLVLWVGMAGTLAATRDDRQITVDVVARFVAPRRRAAIRVLTDLFTSVVCAVLAWHGTRLVAFDREGGLIAFAGVPVWVCELVLPVAFAVIAVRSLLMAWRHLLAATGGEVP